MQIAIVQQEKTLCAAKRDNLVDRRIMGIICVVLTLPHPFTPSFLPYVPRHVPIAIYAICGEFVRGFVRALVDCNLALGPISSPFSVEAS